MNVFHTTFVSHAHVDNDLCDRYVDTLRARGIDTWYDRNNAQAGHFLGTEIQRELQQRTAFVLLMTQQSLDSFWVQLELQAYLGLMAQDRSRILLPVRIGVCQVPPFLNALFWIDAQSMPFDQAINAIAAALTVQEAGLPQSSITASAPPLNALPPLGPAPAPANSTPALHLTPTRMYNLGYRGYTIGGGECILPPICPVPAGIFTMGSDKVHDPSAKVKEMPQYPVEVDAFAIGQHPVTVAEYACAVRAKVVREPPKSLSFHVDWAKQQTHPDHPVVCVSWNDVATYLTWLANLTGLGWRLPTEAEWEKAARGTDGRTYPWGDTFDKTHCNIGEGNRNGTTSIGSYANGDSPYHVQDMAGNVWEWTSSLDRPYPWRQDDGRETYSSSENKILRGGSWGIHIIFARAACRDGIDNPESVQSNIGFRLVLSESSPS